MLPRTFWVLLAAVLCIVLAPSSLYARGGDRVQIGKNIVVEEGEEAGSLVCVGCSISMAGTLRRHRGCRRQRCRGRDGERRHRGRRRRHTPRRKRHRRRRYSHGGGQAIATSQCHREGGNRFSVGNVCAAHAGSGAPHPRDSAGGFDRLADWTKPRSARPSGHDCARLRVAAFLTRDFLSAEYNEPGTATVNVLE